MRGETSAPVSSTGGAADQEEKWSQFVLNLYTKKKTSTKNRRSILFPSPWKENVFCGCYLMKNVKVFLKKKTEVQNTLTEISIII